MKPPTREELLLAAAVCRHQARIADELGCASRGASVGRVAAFLEALVRIDDAGDEVMRARALLTYGREEYAEGVADGRRKAELEGGG